MCAPIASIDEIGDLLNSATSSNTSDSNETPEVAHSIYHRKPSRFNLRRRVQISDKIEILHVVRKNKTGSRETPAEIKPPKIKGPIKKYYGYINAIKMNTDLLINCRNTCVMLLSSIVSIYQFLIAATSFANFALNIAKWENFSMEHILLLFTNVLLLLAPYYTVRAICVDDNSLVFIGCALPIPELIRCSVYCYLERTTVHDQIEQFYLFLGYGCYALGTVLHLFANFMLRRSYQRQ